jgi:hypothetical protein
MVSAWSEGEVHQPGGLLGERVNVSQGVLQAAWKALKVRKSCMNLVYSLLSGRGGGA